MFRLVHFPRSWKCALIHPIHKPGNDPAFPQSYRPISLLSTLSKLAEKLILEKLLYHTHERGIIQNEQFGFRPKHSPTHQLLRVCNKIIEGFNNKEYSVAVFLDIKRAFDKTWHDAIIYKLIKYDFPSFLVHLIASFLRGRFFKVKIQDTHSSSFRIRSGVPQGSSLSPLLFAIYQSDMPTSRGIDSALYADDTALIISHTQLDFAILRLQCFLKHLEKWFSEWRIAANTTKTKAVIFTRRKYENPRNITFFEDTIEWTQEAKYLGITLDHRLSFHTHINGKIEACRRIACKPFPLIGRHSKLTLENKILLYKMVIRPVFLYGVEVWGNTYNYNIHKLQVTQNRILRTISKARWFIRNDTIHRDLRVPYLKDYIYSRIETFFGSIGGHSNPLIAQQVNYTKGLRCYAFAGDLVRPPE